MKIMLATDGSTYADEAAWLLSHLPHREKIELIVLTVVYAPEIHGVPEPLSTVEARESLVKQSNAERAYAEKVYQRIESMFEGANVDVRHVIAEGHIARTIVEQAEEHDPDLLVLGAQGHSAFERILLGSISDFVATHATCSVLLVRPTGLRGETNAGQPHRRLKLCLAYDDSEPSRRAIASLRQFGWGQHTDIDILNVVSFVDVYVSEIPIQIDRVAVVEALHQMVARAGAEVEDISPNVNVAVEEAEHIGRGICDFAEDRGSDMIVMGDTGRGMLGRFLLGSTSRYVLRHCSSSVWIVREKKPTA